MACVYFVLDLPEDDPSPTSALVKALPILSLIWFVCVQGVRYGEYPTSYVTYNRRILYGLVFSLMGDVLLIWQAETIYFVAGMLCFVGTQICYILAFGFAPFGTKELIPCCIGYVAAMSIIYPCLPTVHYLSFIVPVYGILLMIMGWRSLACFKLNGDIPWRKILCAVGAVLFVVSDSCIAINKFCYSIPLQHIVIMSTYYAAQLCISLSVINFFVHVESVPRAGLGWRDEQSVGGHMGMSLGGHLGVHTSGHINGLATGTNLVQVSSLPLCVNQSGRDDHGNLIPHNGSTPHCGGPCETTPIMKTRVRGDIGVLSDGKGIRSRSILTST